MMKRTLLSFILAIGMVANIWADTVIEGIKYALNDDFTATVTGLDDPSFTGTITIPETIKSYGNTYQVVQIGDKAFFEYKFKSVVIPNSVTSIGDSAFCKCTGLTSIDIPNSVTSIGNYAFRDCTGLTSVTIPNSVTSIGNYAFRDCTGLTSVTIPNSVTSIGGWAFYNCSGLTAINVDENNTAYSSIDGVLFNKSQTELVQYPGGKQGAYTIPNSVTSIGKSAFYNCTSLTSVTIGNSVTSIGEWAFGVCSSLTSVTIGNSVTSIGEYAFSYCSSLISVNIPNTVDSISSYTFLFCSGLTSVTIPNSVTSIGEAAFLGCSRLTSVTIPNSVTSIGSEAFYGCSGLTSVTIPNSVTSIGQSAFRGCSRLTSVTIPNSVTSIGDEAFYYCSRLTSVTINSNAIMSKSYSSSSNLSTIFGKQVQTYIIGDSVTSIGEWAFYNCTSLTSVTIPNSVTSIGYSAFYNCTGLTNIYCHIDDPITIDSYVFYKVPKNTCTLHVPLGSKEKYEVKNQWKDFLNIVEDLPAPSSFTIGNLKYTINSNSTVRVSKDGTLTGELVIPESVEYEGKQYSVTRIGVDAFSDCTGLTSVTIPNSVTSIGDYAFRDCSGLTSVTIGNSVTSIGDYAFLRCTGLTSVTINSNAIMSKSNSSSSNLSTIFGKQVQTYIIGDSVTNIGNYAFVNCTGLTAINVDENNTAYSSIDGVLFNKSQTELVCYPGGKQGAYTIPNSVTSIGLGAFYGCSGLTSVTIPNSVTSLGNGVFAFCTGLTSVAIPNSVTSINNATFMNCTSLISIDIPNSVTTIVLSAFSGCTGLTSVTIPNSVTSIGNSAFSRCTGLTDIYCHIEEPLTIESSVFRNVPTNTCTLHVPIGSKEKYEVADVWKSFLNIVEDLPTGIVSIDNSQLTIDNDVWFTLNGVRLNGKPTIPGIYIVNGKRVVVK